MTITYPSFGQPSKCTDDRIEKIVEALGKGVSRNAAVAYAGITYSTFLRWLNRGQVQLTAFEAESINEIPENDLQYVKLFQAVSAVEAALEETRVQHWLAHTEGDWQATERYLARRFPKTWGNRADNEPSEGDAPNGVSINSGSVQVAIYMPDNRRDGAAPTDTEIEGS